MSEHVAQQLMYFVGDLERTYNIQHNFVVKTEKKAGVLPLVVYGCYTVYLLWNIGANA